MKFQILKFIILFSAFLISIPQLALAKYVVITCYSDETGLLIKDYYFSDPKFNTLIVINKGLSWNYAGSQIQHNFSGGNLSVMVSDNRGYIVGYNIPGLNSQSANQLKGTSIFQETKANAIPVNKATPSEIICSMQIIDK
ncbi:MAG: hypothetical protein AB7F64_06525 [Gammaproteobacteria bacterium]